MAGGSAAGRNEKKMEYTDWLQEQNWLKKGDCVYVISDMLELAKSYKARGSRLCPDELTEGLQRIVGEEGTLLFPTFNWDFCKGTGFDYSRTPVRTGAWSKSVLQRKDFARTAHPLYSFAVWGHHREELLENDSADSFGPGTIFELLLQWDARLLAVGLPALKGASYIHHVEQMVGVPYRYNKSFTGEYRDAWGRCGTRTYRMYVRDLDLDPRHIAGFRPLEEKMSEEGLIRTEYYGEIPSHMLRIADLDREVRKDILENDSRNMYDYKRDH